MSFMKRRHNKRTIRRFLGRFGALIVLMLAMPTLACFSSGNRDMSHAQGVSQHLAQSYYLSVQGNDQAAGTSRSTAWRTLERLNRQILGPCDRIQLEGGGHFEGPLVIDSGERGSRECPISVTTYGEGRAIIIGGKNKPAVFAYNTEHIRISNLDLKAIREPNIKALENISGLEIVNDLSGNVQLKDITIDNIDVHGFSGYGILIDGNNGKSGFTHVRISKVNTSVNSRGGIEVRGQFDRTSRGYAHHDIVVTDSISHDNPGLDNPLFGPTGSGIVLSDVQNGRVERSEAYGNGYRCNSLEGGPVGIWSWDSDRITIQNNYSHDNRTAGRLDGGGFDLDGGVTNSLIQYNFSRGNDGAGYLFAQFPVARKFSRNAARYNVSINDGRRNNYGAIYAFGKIDNSLIYNNTVYVDTPTTGMPPALHLSKNSTAAMGIFNNIFVVNGKDLLSADIEEGQQTLRMEANFFGNIGGKLNLKWKDKVVHSFTEFKFVSNQEASIHRPELNQSATELFPSLAAISPNEMSSLRNAQLITVLTSDQLTDLGMDLKKMFKINTRSKDIRGYTSPSGAGYDLGAYEVH